MPQGARIAGFAAGALALGLAAGWVAGRASIPAPPPPRPFVNPLAEVKRGESLALRQVDGAIQSYRVLEADDFTVLLSVEMRDAGGSASTRQIRVARTFPGFFIILEGDVPPEEAAATAREFVVESMAPDEIHVEPLGRSFRCWRIRGHHRVSGDLTYWVTDEVPVQGLLRIDSFRGKLWEVKAITWGP